MLEKIPSIMSQFGKKALNNWLLPCTGNYCLLAAQLSGIHTHTLSTHETPFLSILFFFLSNATLLILRASTSNSISEFKNQIIFPFCFTASVWKSSWPTFNAHATKHHVLPLQTIHLVMPFLPLFCKPIILCTTAIVADKKEPLNTCYNSTHMG